MPEASGAHRAPARRLSHLPLGARSDGAQEKHPRLVWRVFAPEERHMIEPLKWSPLYSVYNRRLDEDHEKILTLINRLEDRKLREITSREFLDELWRQLADYADRHFSAEEAIMKRVGYPDLAGHKMAHDQFRADIARFRREFDKDQATLDDYLLNYLKSWFIRHVLTADRKYAEYCRERGMRVE
jgi:hemerythrin-like metal-binding protein